MLTVACIAELNIDETWNIATKKTPWPSSSCDLTTAFSAGTCWLYRQQDILNVDSLAALGLQVLALCARKSGNKLQKYP